MKSKYILATGLLALANLALSPSLKASNTANAGDLFLGFEQSGNANNYVVDLGPASAFINATGSFNVNTTLGLGNLGADLTATYGANWASNSATTLVNWGVAGATDNLSSTFGLPTNTLFFTAARDTPGTQTTPLPVGTLGHQRTIDSALRSFASGFNGSDQTANSNFATIQSSSLGNSWSGESPGSSAFLSGLNIEQGASGTNIGPTNSVLDLYELQPATGGGPGTYLGDFSLDSSGNLTFTSATAVPEPATWGAAVAVLVLLGFQRRRTVTLA